VLKWANIPPDEGYGAPPDESSTPASFGPYIQSERLQLYRDAATRLVEHGFAYKCYYTDEQVLVCVWMCVQVCVYVRACVYFCVCVYVCEIM